MKNHAYRKLKAKHMALLAAYAALELYCDHLASRVSTDDLWPTSEEPNATYCHDGRVAAVGSGD